MPLTMPYTFVADDIAAAEEVNQNFAAVVAKFLGGIVDADCSVNMDWDFNKGSSAAGKRLSEPKFENNSVSARVLQSDAGSPGSDVNRAVSGDHIKLLTVASLARFMPAAWIPKTMLKVTVSSRGLTGTINANTVATFAGTTFAPVTPLISTILPLACWLEGPSVSFLAAPTMEVKASDGTIGFVVYFLSTQAGTIDLSLYTLKFAYLAAA